MPEVWLTSPTSQARAGWSGPLHRQVGAEEAEERGDGEDVEREHALVGRVAEALEPQQRPAEGAERDGDREEPPAAHGQEREAAAGQGEEEDEDRYSAAASRSGAAQGSGSPRPGPTRATNQPWRRARPRAAKLTRRARRRPSARRGARRARARRRR